MPQIHILDEITANQIAAGEVVERPMNAIKELTENAIDAGATEIEIEIEGGGVTSMRVTDNGCGMSPEDAALSIVRHATSKIQTVDQIYHIASLGFRGEALASIAGVSQMTVTTRTKDADSATVIRIEGGNVKETAAIGAPVGTTIRVCNLFYNVPARKKFLKTERTETSRITQMVGKMAMANPDISFRLINDGRTTLETPGNGRLLDVLTALYGVDVSGEMLDVRDETETALVEGLISKPSLLKSSRERQTILVNRRVVENATVSKAIDNAYHSLLPKNGYPIVALHIHVAPETIDVNVHPQKREIKFEDEQAIFRLVYHAVLGALTSQNTPEAVAASMIGAKPKETLPEAARETVVAMSPVSGGNQNPETEAFCENMTQSAYGGAAPSAPSPMWGAGSGARTTYTPSVSAEAIHSKESLFPDWTRPEMTSSPLFDVPTVDEDAEPVIPLGQIADCFIVCRHGNDLFLIDQHAAHERVRYDRFAAATDGIPTQDILVPYLISVDAEDMPLLLDHAEDIARLGISFEQAGPDVIRVTAAPEDLGEIDTERAVRAIAAALHEKDCPSPESLRHRMMAYAACRGAIKKGDPLNIRQMRELISELFATSRPFVCPHGRPTIVRFTPDELGRLFHRT